MTFTILFQFIFNGIVLGSIYIIVAIGLSVIFGMLGVVNFAHGILYMLGAYATVGEICDVWRQIYSIWKVPLTF